MTILLIPWTDICNKWYWFENHENHTKLLKAHDNPSSKKRGSYLFSFLSCAKTKSADERAGVRLQTRKAHSQYMDLFLTINWDSVLIGTFISQVGHGMRVSRISIVGAVSAAALPTINNINTRYNLWVLIIWPASKYITLRVNPLKHRARTWPVFAPLQSNLMLSFSFLLPNKVRLQFDLIAEQLSVQLSATSNF